MKKSLTFKIIMIITLVIIAIISFNYSKSLNNTIISSNDEKMGPVTGSDLYIAGYEFSGRWSDEYEFSINTYMCIYPAGTEEEHKCDVKVTEDDYYDEGIYKTTLPVVVDDLDNPVSEPVYYYTVYSFDACNREYDESYSGKLNYIKDGDIYYVYMKGSNVVTGDSNLWCDGKKYSKADFGIDKYWDDGNYRYTQRPPYLYYYLGTYENGEYQIDLSTEISFSTNYFNWSGYKKYYNLSTLQEHVLFEKFENIDNYTCSSGGTGRLSDYSSIGEKVEIDGVKYCAFRFTMTGATDYSFLDIYNRVNSNLGKNYNISIVWDDNDNQDGKRPSSINAYAYLNNKSVANTYLYSSNNWTKTIALSDKDYNGNDVTYDFRVSYSNYTFTAEQDDDHNVVITGKHDVEKTSITVTNTWKDLVGDSPEKIEINLLRNGEIVDRAELTAENDWTYTFEADKYYNGSVAKYGVQERAIEGFDLEVKGNQTSGFELINTQTGEFRKVKIMLESVCGSGTITGSEELIYGSDSSPNGIVITADEDYYIDYIKVNGEKIPLEEKLTSYVMDQFEDLEEDVNISVCFKRFDGKVLGVQFLGNIVNNPNTKVGIFTTTLMIGLIATGALVVQGVSRKSFKNSRFNIGATTALAIISLISLINVVSVNSRSISQNTDEKAWPETNPHQPLYILGFKLNEARIRVVNNSNGEEYTYSPGEAQGVLEPGLDDDVINYTADTIDSNLGYYKFEVPDNTSYKVYIEEAYCTDKHYEQYRLSHVTISGGPAFVINQVETIQYKSTCDEPIYHYSMKVNKTWNDENNLYGTRPDAIDIDIYEYDTDRNPVLVKSCTLKPNENWSCVSSDRDEPLFRTMDNDGAYGYIEEELIYNNGKQFDTTERDYSCNVSPSNSNKCRQYFYNVPHSTSKLGNDYFYTYSVPVSNYLQRKTPNETTHNLYTVEKIWDDENNNDRLRPSNITIFVGLEGFNESIYDSTVTLNESNNWTSTFWVNKNVDPEDISISEVLGSGYRLSDYNMDLDAKKITLTNKHEIIKTSVKVTNVWANATDGQYPETAFINLLADGEIIDNIEVTAVGGWTYTFENLPKYENGRLIAYTVSKRLQDGYYVEITGDATNGYTVTNVKTEETRTVQVLAEVKCGEGTITGSEELLYGANSTPNAIVAKGAENYAIDYVMINDDKREMDDLTTKYVFDRFLNVTSDQTVQVCFVDAEQQLTEINKDKEPEPEKEENKEPVNPNTGDFIKIISVVVVLSLIVVVILIANYKKVKRVD